MNWKVYDADGNLVNTVFASKPFIERYCEVYGYTFEQIEMPEPEPPEPEPTQLDIIEAQVAYTAMMTDTLLEV